MSFIDDFDAIKADLAKLEEAKAKQPMNVSIEEGQPTDWTDVNLYGFALSGGPHRPEDDLTCFPRYFGDELRAFQESQRRYLSPFYQQVLRARPSE